MKKETILNAVKNIFLLVILIALWAIISSQTNPIFVPPPSKVFDSFVEVVKNGQLFKALQYSFLRITISTIISALIAIPVGILIYNVKFARSFFVSNNQRYEIYSCNCVLPTVNPMVRY